MKLDQEARMTIKHLTARGVSRREIGRLLEVDESTIRYHVHRQSTGAVDGRSRQPLLAERWAEAIGNYLEAVDGGPVNLAALHDWLVEEHDYPGSLRSVQRYFGRRYPKPKRRARRRVETPPGAQAQADWAVWPRLRIGGEELRGYQFHLRLSHSRFGACVWSPRKDQLSWHRVHNEGFRRLEGVPATVRVDNEKTAVSRGAGAWGELNDSYRRYARAVRFHIDACPPRSPHYKAKVERGIRTERRWLEVRRRHWYSWEELQAWTDEQMLREAHRRLCAATGSSIWRAWQAEKAWLAPLPFLPEPFDVAVTRRVAEDCTVAFEGRRYSVPFLYVGQQVEVRGCATVIQVFGNGIIVAQHPRHGEALIVLDPRHFDGEQTERIIPPPPLGRMGQRLAELAAMPPEKRPLDLYAALAEVAR